MQNEKIHKIQKISKISFSSNFRFMISLRLLDVIQRSRLPLGLSSHILEAVVRRMSCFSTLCAWWALVLLLRSASISLLGREAFLSIVSLIDS